MLLALGLLVSAVINQWSDFVNSIAQLNGFIIALSATFGVLALLCTGLGWRSSVRASTTVNLSIKESFRVFFITQLGKYIPGAIWPTVMQMETLKKFGADRFKVFIGSCFSMWAQLTSAVLLGGVLLLFNKLLFNTVIFTDMNVSNIVSSDSRILSESLNNWLMNHNLLLIFMLLACGLLLLLPFISMIRNFAIHLFSAVFKKFQALRDPSFDDKKLWMALCWNILGNVFWGLHAFVLVHGLSSEITFDLKLISLMIAIFAISWAVGFVIIFAPGGLGPRELMLTLFLTGLISQPSILSFIVISRVMSILLDGVLALLFFVLVRNNHSKEIV